MRAFHLPTVDISSIQVCGDADKIDVVAIDIINVVKQSEPANIQAEAIKNIITFFTSRLRGAAYIGTLRTGIVFCFPLIYSNPANQ
jgi:hypothetical protein